MAAVFVRVGGFAVAVLCVAGMSAQTKSVAKPEAEPAPSFGVVSGHVYLAGSNVPARLVNVNLQPLQVQEEKATFSPGRVTPLPFTVYQTDLAGSYTIPHVAAGLYYVIVNAPGFLSPFAEFTSEELKNPSPEIAKRIAESLPVISVGPNATVMHDVRLQRGASLSGTVRFDDGHPMPGRACSCCAVAPVANGWLRTATAIVRWRILMAIGREPDCCRASIVSR